MLTPRLARTYFAIQAVAVAIWWAGLVVRSSWRAYFWPPTVPDVALFAFAPGDLLLLGLGSALAASPALPRGVRPALAWLVTGATVYGAFFTVSLALTGLVGPLGALLMCPAALASGLAAASFHDDFGALSTGRPS